VSLFENNNFKPFSNSKSYTMFIPCPRETWLHAANPTTGRKKMKAKYYPKLSPPLDPQSRNAPSPIPQLQPAQTNKAWHPTTTSETPTPRRDFVRSADSAPAKKDQIRPTTTNEILTPRRDVFDFVRSAEPAPAKTD
jgi:hypothetical protein